jgi:hypothetical protein
MSFNLKKNDVVTLWVNQVMFPGAVTSVENGIVSLDSIQHAGLRYQVRSDSITAITIDSKTDTLEKYEEQKKAFEAKQKAAADAMREEAAQLEAQGGN